MKRAIIIMAKVPVKGNVKTRLQPFFTEVQSSEIAKCFLLDIENKVKNKSDQSFISFSPIEKKEELLAILQHEHVLIEQKGENLGERICDAFRFAFEDGFGAVVMMGTDSPTISGRVVESAFDHLEAGTDVVLGETIDGGFYLIGLRVLRREIFREVEWSSENTAGQIKQNTIMAKLSLSFLPRCYDVDLPEDIEKLKKELEEKPGIAPYTAKWLKKI